MKRPFNLTAPIIDILGNPGFGKTDYFLWMCEKLFDLGRLDNVVTNIKVFDDERFHFVNKTSQIKKLIEGKELPGKLLVSVDEAGMNLDSRSSQSKINKKFKSLVRLIRKHRSGFSVLSQFKKDYDISIQQLITTRIVKDAVFHPDGETITNSIAHYYITYPVTYRSFTLTKVPRTSITFDTFDIAELSFDESGEDLLDKIKKKGFTPSPRQEACLSLILDSVHELDLREVYNFKQSTIDAAMAIKRRFEKNGEM